MPAREDSAARTMTSQESRRFPRKDLETKVRYTTDEGEFVGRAVDVSEGGMCIETSYPHKPEGPISVFFKIFGTRQAPLKVDGQIMWVKKAAPQPGSILKLRLVGVKFGPMDWASEKDIRFYVFNWKTEQAKEGPQE